MGQVMYWPPVFFVAPVCLACALLIPMAVISRGPVRTRVRTTCICLSPLCGSEPQSAGPIEATHSESDQVPMVPQHCDITFASALRLPPSGTAPACCPPKMRETRLPVWGSLKARDEE